MTISTTTPRQLQTQQIHYFRKTIDFGDNAQVIDVGVIPAGALVLKPLSGIAINTAFNGSSQSLDIGPSDNTDLWATDLSLSVATFVPCDENVSFLVTAVTLVQCVFTSTSASAGEGEVIIAFIPDNDG
jgi:hypothetical protein